MGFNIEINSILRSDEPSELVKGQTFPFRKTGSRVYFDTLPIWLTRSDWTALAEIEVISQTRTPAEVNGSFRVLHVYAPAEAAALTAVFRRLYASGGDPYAYLLIGGADYQQALRDGSYAPASLGTEGFIHASPAAQLTRVANKYYTQVKDVQVVLLALSKIQPEVKWEPATGGLYPHIYGPLNMDAAVKAVPVHPDANNVFNIRPEDLTV